MAYILLKPGTKKIHGEDYIGVSVTNRNGVEKLTIVLKPGVLRRLGWINKDKIQIHYDPDSRTFKLKKVTDGEPHFILSNRAASPSSYYIVLGLKNLLNMSRVMAPVNYEIEGDQLFIKL